MERKTLVKTFCSVLDDFLKDVYSSYPDPSLMILITTSKAIISSNPEIIVSNFMACIEPYSDKIKKEDSSFFLKGGLSNNLSGTPYSFLIDEINKVSEIWNRPDTSEKTKKSIWKYFNVLLLLGTKIKQI